MILVDNGYLVALVETRDELHERAVRWAKIVNEPLFVSEYVLWEVVNALFHPFDRPKAHFWIDRVHSRSGFEYLAATRELTEAGIDLHADRPDKAWSVTDCISFVVMEKTGIGHALSHDHHFEQAGFEALLRRDPE